MANSIDDVYGSKAGVDFAKLMAEVLSKQGNYIPDASMAKLPGSWMYGVPGIVDALKGAQYRDIMGSQDKVQSDRMLDPNAKPTIKSYGSPVSNKVNRPSAPYGGGDKVSSATPSPGQDDLTTGSISSDTPDIGGVNTGGPKPLSEGFFNKTGLLESGGDYSLVNKYGYRGKYQFSPEELRKYGIKGDEWKDPATMEKVARQHFNDLKQEVASKIGREPTDGEVYLAHQRGVDGFLVGQQNPDRPEWVNMLNTGEGRQRYAKSPSAAIAWAQRTVRDNVPKTDPTRRQLEAEVGQRWYLKMTSGQFQPIWKNRFGDKPTESPLTGQAGDAQLGGGAGSDVIDKGEESAVGGETPFKTAQAFPSVPTAGGPIGNIPPANPIESDAQLQARLRAASPDQRQEILENYLKRKEGREYDTLGGKATVTPTKPGEQPIVTERTTKTIPFSVGDLHLQLAPDGSGGFSAVLPDGSTKNFSSADAVWKWAQEGHARGVDLNTRTEKRANRYEDIQGHAEQTYQSTADRGRQLELAQKLVDDPKFISGSFQEQREMISKFFNTMGIEPPANGSDITQAFVKLVAGNILDDIKGLGGQGLGQIRAKEMEIIEKMNAAPNMSPGAVRAVITLMRKANDRMQNHNDRVLDYSTEKGKIDPGFYRQMQKYYRDNPLLTDSEINHYKKIFQGPEAKKEGDATAPEGGTSKRWTKGADGVWVYK